MRRSTRNNISVWCLVIMFHINLIAVKPWWGVLIGSVVVVIISILVDHLIKADWRDDAA